MNKTLKLGLILGLYAAVSCLCLAIVNNFTSPAIKERALQKEKEGLKIVFSSATEFTPIENDLIAQAISLSNENLGSIKIDGIYCAQDSNKNILGYVAKITGPSYETPAEYKYFRLIGADVVGMSTIPEVIVARHSSIPVFGISVVTNEAHDDYAEDYVNDADDVVEAADAAADKMTLIFTELIRSL